MTKSPAPARIFVASDLSERSRFAVSRGISLARQHQAELIVVHMIDQEAAEDSEWELEKRARDRLAEQIAGEPGSEAVNIVQEVIEGLGFEDVITCAGDCDADLILCGPPKPRRWLAALGGTTVGQIVRFSAVPVLVAAQRAQGPHRRILSATDFSAEASIALHLGRCLAPDADYRILHVAPEGAGMCEAGRKTGNWTGAAWTRDPLRQALLGPSLDLDLDFRVRTGNPLEGIRAEIDEMNPDLLCIGAGGEMGVALSFLGNVAGPTIAAPNRDVLIAKHPYRSRRGA